MSLPNPDLRIRDIWLGLDGLTACLLSLSVVRLSKDIEPLANDTGYK